MCAATWICRLMQMPTLIDEYYGRTRAVGALCLCSSYVLHAVAGRTCNKYRKGVPPGRSSLVCKLRDWVRIIQIGQLGLSEDLFALIASFNRLCIASGRAFQPQSSYLNSAEGERISDHVAGPVVKCIDASGGRSQEHCPPARLP